MPTEIKVGRIGLGINYAKRHIQDVVGALRNAEGKCVVLMGAGCSLSAGIPLAGTFVEEIRKRFPEVFDRAKTAAAPSAPNYNQCMEQLPPIERQKLLNAYIDKASINWAHLALAQLFSNEKIDRVLTVNFDPLLIKACAMVNFFPAIYDLAGASAFKRHRIAPRSLFYLNGQHTGFVTLNAGDELEAHRGKLRTIVQDTGVRRLWLVVGYSGEADPLLEVLKEQDCFDGDLYWLGYEPEPSRRLLESGIFQPGRHAFYVSGQDADASLTALAQGVDSFPPDLLVKPFEHVRLMVESIKFESGGEYALELKRDLEAKLQAAAAQESQSSDDGLALAGEWMLAGDYGGVLQWHQGLSSPQADANDLAAWALVMQGNKLCDQGGDLAVASISDAQSLWAQAGEKYALALTIKSDMHEAAYNWGSALDDEAQAVAVRDVAESRRLWALAGEKYSLALSIKSDKHEAANNWGIALGHVAQAVAASDAVEARRLWALAGEKYALALSIKPDLHEAVYNWGNALEHEAQAVADSDVVEARRLWALAGEKYAQALTIKSDKHEAANNWGSALEHEAQAVTATDVVEARRLRSLAEEKYALALTIKPDDHEVANNWGTALDHEAQAVATTDVGEARRLWARAGEKYALALIIKSDKHEAANNWGIALGHEAQAVAATDVVEARRLWTLAGEKYALTLTIKPDLHEAAYNWGSALDDEAQAVAAIDVVAARRLWSLAGEKYALALIIKPHDHEAAHNWGSALGHEAQVVATTDVVEARRLWALAGEKYALALTIKPDMHEAANNWGSALGHEAQAVAASDVVEAQRLWALAGEKYALALTIKSDKHRAANNWGGALQHEAQAVAACDVAEARRVWALAGEKYALALTIKPDMHDAANNWGIALGCEAEAVAARRVWALAREKYALALTIKPDDHELANNWATAVLKEWQSLGEGEQSNRGRDLLNRARALLEQHANMGQRGVTTVAYNLACVYAQLGESGRAVEQLQVCVRANDLPVHWPIDIDLDPIRGTIEFQAWASQQGEPGDAQEQ